MCVAALAWQADPRWMLVVIGNRDEYHARAAAPLERWPESPVIAGRDLQAGGTWMGVGPGGFGLVTNLRVPGYPRPDMASRGRLITDWLEGTAPTATEAMNPFNLWLGSAERLRFFSNYPEPHELDLQPGIHGLSNGARGDRWFKTARLEEALALWLAEDRGPEDLFAALADQTPESGDPEDAFSSVFIRNPTYGTRCSTIALVDAHGSGQIIERRFDPWGECTGQTQLEFEWQA